MTAVKRKSISGIPFLIPGVTPSVDKNAAWRMTAGWSYPIHSSSEALGIVKICGISVSNISRINGVPIVNVSEIFGIPIKLN